MSTKPMPGGRPNTEELVFSPGYVLAKRYLIKKQLGIGGMAQVYEAVDQETEEKKAIKVLREIVAKNDRSAKRFAEEGLITKSLDHPNIVQVSDAGIAENGHRYLVMELLSGGSLEEWLENKEADEESFIRQFVSVIINVCDGLQSAHDKNIVHRDLKPSNIFLHEDDSAGENQIVPKIVDFGIAKRLDSDATKLTLTGDICGTTEYIAPERILGSEPDNRSDIYSLGIILYHGLTSKSPLMVNTTEASNILFRRAVDPIYKIDHPRSINPHVSKQLEKVCLKAMSRDPVQRHDSAEKLGQDLSDCLLVKKSSTPKWAAAAVVAVSVGALLFWMLSRNEEVETEPSNVQEPAKVDFEKPVEPPPPVEEPKIEEPKDTKPPTAETESPKTIPSIQVKPVEKTTPEIEPEPSEAEKLIKEGNKELSNRNYANAGSLFGQAVLLNPRLAEAWFGRGKSEFKQGQYQNATLSIEAAVDRRPGNKKWRIYLGKVHMAAGEQTKAVEQWKKVLTQDPENEEAKQYLQEAGIELEE